MAKNPNNRTQVSESIRQSLGDRDRDLAGRSSGPSVVGRPEFWDIRYLSVILVLSLPCFHIHHLRGDVYVKLEDVRCS